MYATATWEVMLAPFCKYYADSGFPARQVTRARSTVHTKTKKNPYGATRAKAGVNATVSLPWVARRRRRRDDAISTKLSATGK